MKKLLVFMVASLTVVPGSARAQERKPNVIFILADDLGWGDLSCYGNAFLKTPNLDRLASQGALFTHFYVAGSVCSPSRCGFFTGQYPARQKIHGHYATPELNKSRAMSQWLEPSVHNLAALLRRVGYATAHIGKWHLGSGPGAPKIGDYGFDFAGTGETGGANVTKEDPYFRARSTKLFVDEALQFINKNRDRPFYIQLWTLVPHATLNPTPEQLAPFEKWHPKNVPHQSARSIFYASVNDLDQQVGRLMDELEKLGLAKDTIVVFSSDNGPEDIFIVNAGHSGVGSSGPFRGRKRSLYEGGVRVPFIVRWPGRVPAGRVEDKAIVSGVDFVPTICKAAGVALPNDYTGDGEDMSDVWQGKSRGRTRPLLWEWRFRIAGHPWNVSPQLAIRDGDWKLLMNPDRSRIELYDIPRDPMQASNLAEKHPEIVSRLGDQVLAWQKTLPQGHIDPGAGLVDYPWPGQPSAKKTKKKAE